MMLPLGVPEAVLDRYPRLRRAATWRPLSQGTHASTWLITTLDDRSVLRRYPADLSAGRAQLSATAHQHAAGDGLAPAIIPDHGGYLLTHIGGHAFTLTEHMNGDAQSHKTPSTVLCYDLGRVLGRLHERLRTCPNQKDAPRFTLTPIDPTTPIRAALASHVRPDCPHQRVREVLNAKLRRAEKIPADLLTRCQFLPQTLIHGDFHLPNILLNGNRVTAVVDFDLARLAPPGYELVRGLLYCVQPHGGPSAFEHRVRAFLAGYFAAALLTMHEIDTTVDLYRTVQILDTHGLDVCAGATDGLLRFGQARFALLHWLDRYGPLVPPLAREYAEQRRSMTPHGT